jgi:hypothetical protein
VVGLAFSIGFSIQPCFLVGDATLEWQPWKVVSTAQVTGSFMTSFSSQHSRWRLTATTRPCQQTARQVVASAGQVKTWSFSVVIQPSCEAVMNGRSPELSIEAYCTYILGGHPTVFRKAANSRTARIAAHNIVLEQSLI